MWQLLRKHSEVRNSGGIVLAIGAGFYLEAGCVGGQKSLEEVGCIECFVWMHVGFVLHSRGDVFRVFFLGFSLACVECLLRVGVPCVRAASAVCLVLICNVWLRGWRLACGVPLSSFCPRGGDAGAEEFQEHFVVLDEGGGR